MDYKGHLIVVAVVGALGVERWQVLFSIHKTTGRGLECVHRCDDERCYATREEAADAGFRNARAWVDESCRVN